MVLHRLKTAIETTMPAKIARMLWRMAMRARQPMTAKPAMRTMLTTMATLLKMPTMPTRTVRMTPTRMPASAQNGNDNDKNDAAKDDADADEHIMRDRFTFNRKTVMCAARNVAVPEPDWRSCCASANPIRRWRSERASRQATGLVRAGESLSDQRFTRFVVTNTGDLGFSTA